MSCRAACWCCGPVPDAPPQVLTGGPGAQVRAGAHRGGRRDGAVRHGARRAAAPVQHRAGAPPGPSCACSAATPGGHMSLSTRRGRPMVSGVHCSMFASPVQVCCGGVRTSRAGSRARVKVDACFAWVPLPGAMLGDEADAALRTAPRWAELEPEQASTRTRQPAKHPSAGRPHLRGMALALSVCAPLLGCVATRHQIPQSACGSVGCQAAGGLGSALARTRSQTRDT